MPFFTSVPGQFLAQSLVHSFVTAIIVACFIRAWCGRDSFLRARLRLLPLVLPVAYLPLLLFFFPGRNTPEFRENMALLDVNQWLTLEFFSRFQLWHVAAVILAATSIYFAVRDLLPAIRHYRRKFTLPRIATGQFPRLDGSLARVTARTGQSAPALHLAPETYPVVYSRGPDRVIISAAAIEALDDDELEQVLAHEMAHLSQPLRALHWLSLALRSVMFYNPVALLVFHQVLRDAEDRCDDMAVAWCAKPLALGSGLLKVFRRAVPESGATFPAAEETALVAGIGSLEHRAAIEAVQKRVERVLDREQPDRVSYAGFRLIMVTGLTCGLLFFVV